MAGAPPQHSSQIMHLSSQQHNQPHEFSPSSEERFKNVLMYFTAYTGIRLCERDFVIEGKPVSLLALHKAVFLRNGFESVRLNTISSTMTLTDTCVRYAPTTSGPSSALFWATLRLQVWKFINPHDAGLW